MCPGTAAPRTDLKQSVAVFKLASVILQPLKNPWGHTLQGLKERNKEKQTKSPAPMNGQKLQLHYHSPSSAQKPSLQGLSW